jgi:hypothetical protein
MIWYYKKTFQAGAEAVEAIILLNYFDFKLFKSYKERIAFCG